MASARGAGSLLGRVSLPGRARALAHGTAVAIVDDVINGVRQPRDRLCFGRSRTAAPGPLCRGSGFAPHAPRVLAAPTVSTFPPGSPSRVAATILYAGEPYRTPIFLVTHALAPGCCAARVPAPAGCMPTIRESPSLSRDGKLVSARDMLTMFTLLGMMNICSELGRMWRSWRCLRWFPGMARRSPTTRGARGRR